MQRSPLHPILLSKVIRLLAVACSVVSVANIPPEACTLSVCSLQFGMLLEELVLRLVVRILQTLYQLAVRYIATREVAQLSAQSRIVGATEVSPTLVAIREHSHPLLSDDSLEDALAVATLECAVVESLDAVDILVGILRSDVIVVHRR